jgi:hypothetical protein
VERLLLKIDNNGRMGEDRVGVKDLRVESSHWNERECPVGRVFAY